MTINIPAATGHIQLDITGMTCASCANRIEKKLNKLPGVTATVNYALETATVEHPDEVSVADLIAVVEKTGYGATVPQPPSTQQEAPHTEVDHVATLRHRMLVSLASAIPVILMSMIPPLQFSGWQWISLMLAWPVVTWGAWPFHKAALTNLRHGSTTMDTLVSLGVTAAFGWSLVALLFGTAGELGMRHGFSFSLQRSDQLGNIYLEAAVGIVTFLLIGRFLEARSKRSAGAALRALLDLGAQDVSVLDDPDQPQSERRVAIDQLMVGDVFVVRPGEKIATDGRIITGHSAIDTSMITGESVPREASVGDAVTGGTINATGRLVIRAERIGADTQLAQMAQLVTQAQAGKAGVQRLADKISGVFVPIVIALSVATFGFWVGTGASPTFALTAAVAVLIIACPCALGLATPTAIMVGTGRGSQLGILIKGPEALEATRRIDALMIDKTGTLTTGSMHLASVHPNAGVSETELIMLAAAVETSSEHPLARAITDRAREAGLSLPTATDFHSTTGFGVTATLDINEQQRRVAVARADDAEATGAIGEALLQGRTQGHTMIMVWRDDQLIGLLGVADTVRLEAQDTIAELRRQGIEPILLTGDHQQAADAVAHQVGITHVIAGVHPADKANAVSSLQQQGKRVAMLGDGINDAAALATADLGIAMGAGTDAAIHAADLTLVRNDLRSVVDGIRLARATWRTIIGNLVWAFGYNVIAIPLAAAGLLNPMLAGAAMAASSILVVGNSLRLRGFRNTGA